MIQKQESLYTNLDKAIQTRISPILKNLGFKKKGRLWNRTRAYFIDVIDFQISRTCSSSDLINFTINFGIFYQKINSYIFEEDITNKNNFAKESGCIIRARPQDLNLDTESASFDKWWSVASNKEIENALDEIEILIKTKAMPFFDYFDSATRIIEYLLRKPRGYSNVAFGRAQLAVLLILNGKKEKGREILKNLATPKNAWTDKALQIAQKLDIEI